MELLWFVMLIGAAYAVYRIIMKLLARAWATKKYDTLIKDASDVVCRQLARTDGLDKVVTPARLAAVIRVSVMKSFAKAAEIHPQLIPAFTAQTLALYAMADYNDVTNLREIIFEGDPDAVLVLVAMSQRLGEFLDALSPPADYNMEWLMIVRLCRDIHDRTRPLITQHIREAANAA